MTISMDFTVSVELDVLVLVQTPVAKILAQMEAYVNYFHLAAPTFVHFAMPSSYGLLVASTTILVPVILLSSMLEDSSLLGILCWCVHDFF